MIQDGPPSLSLHPLGVSHISAHAETQNSIKPTTMLRILSLEKSSTICPSAMALGKLSHRYTEADNERGIGRSFGGPGATLPPRMPFEFYSIPPEPLADLKLCDGVKRFI